MPALLTTAAVCRAAGGPLTLEEVELDPPGPGEVRVRILSSGVCHSDWNAASGASATPLPAVLGHEGAGVVEEVGPGSERVAPGDAVGLSWLPSCGSCASCLRGQPELCAGALDQMMTGSLPGGGFRLSKSRERIHHYSYLSTFARHAVVAERSCVVLPDGTDPDVACLVGCAVMTGYGAVVNRAKVRPGSSVVVFGAGGVGLSAIMAARLAGAETVVAVEPSPRRRELAAELGATYVLPPGESTLGELIEHTSGGADYAFEAAGMPDLVSDAFSCVRPGGMVVAVGVPPDGALVSFAGAELVRSEKIVTGTFYGSSRPLIDMPAILRLHSEGRLPLDKLLGSRYRLDQVNEAFAEMASAEGARAIVHPQEPIGVGSGSARLR